ncbi:MAG: DarT1-associated NADAR antitoxin family protein [Eubacteriaceae bacterium]|jgi:hypothetical protein
MAVRPVYISDPESPDFYRTVNPDFKYYCGLAISQRRRSIVSLHEAFHKIYPDLSVLEVSTQSESELGRSLSPFNLTVRLSSGKVVSVESAFQASKVFEDCGPFPDLLNVSSMAAKKDERKKNCGVLTGYRFDGELYSCDPVTYFYNWLYISALMEHPDLAKEILQYHAFTDIVFNPKKSHCCQAQACALYVGLVRKGMLDAAMQDREAFLQIIYNHF